MSTSNKESSDKNDNVKNLWMVRPCNLYDDEYSDCTSIRSRFQQYFVFGKFEDCTPWKHDYNNCLKWKKDKDVDAVEKIIANEDIRRSERLDAHYKNPIWEDRKEPPSDWNAPLPPYLAERLKNTFLELKAQELREGVEVVDKGTFCVIM